MNRKRGSRFCQNFKKTPTMFNWKQFTNRVTIAAPASAVMNAWSTQGGLESWFLRSAVFKSPGGLPRKTDERVQAGDRYRWLWWGYDESTFEEHQVLRITDEEIEFVFSGDCIVNVKAKAENGEMVCELTQRMPMDSEADRQHFYVECGRGWTFYLANLKSILEGGLDLRNKNDALKNVINA
jgi:uncharacterized protein YndB with AHSA1/START domain